MEGVSATGDARPYTTGQVARMSSVHINVVKKWIADGLLRAYRLPAGHYRIPRQAYLDFLLDHDLPVPNEVESERAGRKYLVIDDDPSQLNLLVEFLSRKPGAQVQSAKDGYEGLIQVGCFRPAVVFLDIAMPRMDGFSMLEAMANSAPAITPQVVIVTGNKTPEVRSRMAQFNLAGCIFKPYTLQQIDDVLESLEAA